jgi:hypothetical protein
MSRLYIFFFYACIVLSFASMVIGHVIIINSGLWFIPGKEKYNVFTRWVSDYAALYPQGLWIKGSIVLFCAALCLFKLERLRSYRAGVIGHSLWIWNVFLSIGLIAGLLMVALFDMSPPQFEYSQPSWWQRVRGISPVLLEKPLESVEYVKQWHHRLGFQMFIISFALTLLTAIVEKHFAKNSLGLRKDIRFLIVTFICMIWLFSLHTTFAGIPQRALLVLIFWWVCGEFARMNREAGLKTIR